MNSKCIYRYGVPIVLVLALFFSCIFTNTTAVFASSTVKQASELKGMSVNQVIAKVAPMFTADQKKTGILASVSLAQFLAESGRGQSEVFQNSNNGFGMHTKLSHNTWSGTVWDGISKYTKTTTEYVKGKKVTQTDDYRAYSTFAKSIADHSAYLANAKNGSKYRYAGITTATDYKKATAILQKGGYATATYATALNAIIEKYNLTQYDVKNSSGSKNSSGTESTSGKNTGSANANSTNAVYKITATRLNVRSGPGTKYKVTAVLKKNQQITITRISGKWGKCSKGWVYLGYCKQVSSSSAKSTSANSTSAKSSTAKSSSAESSSAKSSSAASSGSSSTAQTPGTYKVTNTFVRVRQNASTNSAVLGELKKGAVVKVTKVINGWGMITYNGKIAWIYLKYAEKY